MRRRTCNPCSGAWVTGRTIETGMGNPVERCLVAGAAPVRWKSERICAGTHPFLSLPTVGSVPGPSMGLEAARLCFVRVFGLGVDVVFETVDHVVVWILPGKPMAAHGPPHSATLMCMGMMSTVRPTRHQRQCMWSGTWIALSGTWIGLLDTWTCGQIL